MVLRWGVLWSWHRDETAGMSDMRTSTPSTTQFRKFCFLFGKTVQPSVGGTTERLEVSAGLLEGTWGPTTKISARLDHCIAAAYEVLLACVVGMCCCVVRWCF